MVGFPTNPWVFLLNMSGDWGYHHLRKTPTICPSLYQFNLSHFHQLLNGTFFSCADDATIADDVRIDAIPGEFH